MYNTSMISIKLLENPRIRLAVVTATQHHNGQFRKYSNIPYISHPLSVASLVARYTADEDVIIAAILHDVVEDTKMTLGQVFHMFGSQVAYYVHYVTEVADKSCGPRAFRVKLNREHFAAGPAESQLIKIADTIHNISDLDKSPDVKFAKLYTLEKLGTVDALSLAPNCLRVNAVLVLNSLYQLFHNEGNISPYCELA